MNPPDHRSENTDPVSGDRNPRKLLAGVAGLDVARGLTLFANLEEAYLRALGIYVAMYEGGLPALDAHLGGGSPPDRAALKAEMHALGGASTAIGAIDVGARAAALERTLKDIGADLGAPQMTERLRLLQGGLATLVEQIKLRLTVQG